MQLPRDMAQMNAQELRDLAASLFAAGHAEGPRAQTKQLKIDQLTHEMAVLKRWQFGRRSEQLDPAQRSLLEETIDADLEAIERELEALQTKRPEPAKATPRRVALPAHLPRREIPHEPESTYAPAAATSSASARSERAARLQARVSSRSSVTCGASGCAGAARR